MVKKYKQSKRDRMDESRGMRRYERGLSAGSYRRVSGERDMGMIHEDHYETANLPQEVVMKKYPSWRYLNGAYLDDSVRGIDDLNDEAVRRASDSMRRDIY